MDTANIQIVLLILVGIGGGFVQRVSGFGLGIFVMLFLPHFLPSHTMAATVSCLFSCGTSTYNAIKYRKNVPYKVVLPLILSALVTIPVSVYFSARVSSRFFEILLGAVLIFLSLYFLFLGERIKIKASVKNSILAGGLGGTLNGLFSTGGPPIVLYMTNALQDKIMYFAGIQFYFCITNIYATAFRFANGLIFPKVILYTVIGLVGCMIGDFSGKLVFDRLNAKMLKTIIYIGMIISGVVMIF